MPEGDTIFRTAVSLRRWLLGRVVTEARSAVVGLRLDPVVGTAVHAVVPRGKHLLIHFGANDNTEELVLRTHMRMTGSWHIYSAADRWQRPQSQARLVLRCGDRLAVGFNVPDAELVAASSIERTHGLRNLGPDVLVAPFDVAEVIRRTRTRPPSTTVGELLLDQRVAAGIGNVYRCESLFLERVNPWSSIDSLDDAALVALFMRSSTLMRANLGAGAGAGAGRGREVGVGTAGTWVYRRAGRPCRVCETEIRSRPQGEQARIAYWCPSCQAKATDLAR